MVAEKLMANSDRFADPSTFQRDLLHLAFMTIKNLNKRLGFEIAKAAYGDAIDRDLGLAVSTFLDNPLWSDRCIRTLGIAVEPTDVKARVQQLAGL